MQYAITVYCHDGQTKGYFANNKKEAKGAIKLALGDGFSPVSIKLFELSTPIKWHVSELEIAD